MYDIDERIRRRNEMDKRLDVSQAFVTKAAEWFTRRGCLVERPETRKPKSLYDDPRDTSDKGDLFVTGRDLVLSTWDVKGNTLRAWTCRADFKFKRVLVSKVVSVERLNADAYMLIGKNLRCGIITLAGTRHAWSIDKTFEHVKREMVDTYFCPVELCEFVDLDE